MNHEEELKQNLWILWAFGLGILIMLILVVGSLEAEAASTTTQVNYSSDGENISVQVPGGVFSTQCGLIASRTFDITNSYDEVVIYNNITMLNYTTNISSGLINCTGAIDTGAVMQQLNTTMSACINATVYNTTGLQDNMTGFISNVLMPNKYQCDQFNADRITCEGNLKLCNVQLNSTDYKFHLSEESKSMWIWGGALLFLLLIVFVVFVFATSLFRRNDVAKAHTYMPPKTPPPAPPLPPLPEMKGGKDG